MKANASCVQHQDVLVHGELLLHNMLVDDGRLTAVIDWETAHIGHPGEDLGYIRPVIEQMIDWEEFLETYEAAGGIRMSTQEIDFFVIRSVLNLIAMIQYARSAFESGHLADIHIVEVSASLIPKLVNRLASQLIALLGR